MIFMNSFKRISCPNFPSINVHWCLNGGTVLVSVWTKLIQLYDSPPRRLTRRFPRHNPHFLRSSASGWNLRDKNWNICKYLIHIMSGRLVSCHNSQDACLIDYGLWLWAWQASSCGHLPCSCAQPSLYIIPMSKQSNFQFDDISPTRIFVEDVSQEL